MRGDTGADKEAHALSNALIGAAVVVAVDGGVTGSGCPSTGVIGPTRADAVRATIHAGIPDSSAEPEEEAMAAPRMREILGWTKSEQPRCV